MTGNCRGLATRYRPGDRRAWVKVRHADTVDAAVVGIMGTPRRPQTALVELPDGARRYTPRLDALQARQIADVLAGQPAPAPDTAEPGLLVLAVPLAAEVRLGTSRHPTIRFARVKADQDDPAPGDEQ